MRVFKSVGLIALGVLLGIAGDMASARIKAQAVTEVPVVQPGLPGLMITGENIGFQLVPSSNRRDVVTGRLMIKVDGRWLPAAAPTGVVPAR